MGKNLSFNLGFKCLFELYLLGSRICFEWSGSRGEWFILSLLSESWSSRYGTKAVEALFQVGRGGERKNLLESHSCTTSLRKRLIWWKPQAVVSMSAIKINYFKVFLAEELNLPCFPQFLTNSKSKFVSDDNKWTDSNFDVSPVSFVSFRFFRLRTNVSQFDAVLLSTRSSLRSQSLSRSARKEIF